MKKIEQQFVKGSAGKTVSVSTDATPRWKQAPSLVQASSEELEASAAARVAFDQGRMEDARRLLAPHAESARIPATLVTLGRICIADGQLDEAAQWLARAEAHFPEDPQVWKAYAVLFRLLQRPEDELSYRRKLVFLAPRPSAAALLAFAQTFTKVHAGPTEPPLGELQFVSRKLDELPTTHAATAPMRQEIAQHLYQFKSLQSYARRHLEAVQPCPSGSRDVSAAWLSMLQWCSRADIPCRRAVELGKPGRRPLLAKLARVAVMPTLGWIPLLDEENVILDGFGTRRPLLDHELAGSPFLLNRAGRRTELRMPRELPLIDMPALLVGGAPDYDSFLLDSLGALAIAEILKAPADLPLVVNGDLTPQQNELLTMLGKPETSRVQVKTEQPVRFAELWVPSKVVSAGGWVDPLLPRWCRQRLAPALSHSELPRRICFLGGTLKGCRIANEPALVELLTSWDYEIIRMDSLGLSEQIRRIATARHIVSAAGAGLAAMIFAPPGAKIVALADQVTVRSVTDRRFDSLATACEHEFSWLECSPSGRSAMALPFEATITVDLLQLNSTLRRQHIGA